MKTLIVCEDEEVATLISNALKEEGEDCVIVYRYLLKALDNVEEIDSDVAIINAVDYPRHWQVFVEYMAFMDCRSIPVLYTGGNLNYEDAKKARELGIEYTLSSVEDKGLLKKTIHDVLSNANERTAMNKTMPSNGASMTGGNVSKDSAVRLALDNPLTVIFTHPRTNAFIIGKVISVKGNKIDFAPDCPALSETLCKGEVIEEVSFKRNGTMHCAKARIESNEKGGKVLTISLESA